MPCFEKGSRAYYAVFDNTISAVFCYSTHAAKDLTASIMHSLTLRIIIIIMINDNPDSCCLRYDLHACLELRVIVAGAMLAGRSRVILASPGTTGDDGLLAICIHLPTVCANVVEVLLEN
jgi:hypothetical protein